MRCLPFRQVRPRPAFGTPTPPATPEWIIMMRLHICALIAGLTAIQVQPASAQLGGSQSATWSTAQISVSFRSTAACQPTITSVTGSSSDRYLRASVRHPVADNMDVTVSLVLDLTIGTTTLTYRGSGTLSRGDGTVTMSGNVLPTNLGTGRVAINVFDCRSYVRTPPVTRDNSIM